MTQNSKSERILSPQQKVERAARHLLDAAKRDKTLRYKLASFLMDGSLFRSHRTPRIPDRELVIAIRVAGDVLSKSLSNPDKARRWEALRDRLYQLVSFQELARPPLLPGGAQIAHRVIRSMAEGWRLNLNHVLMELQEHERMMLDWKAILKKGPKPRAKRGRRMGERQKDIVGAYEFLRACEERKPAEITAKLLHRLGVKMEADSVPPLVRRYERSLKVGRSGVWIPLDELPLFHIRRIIYRLMDRARRTGQTPKRPTHLETWVKTQLLTIRSNDAVGEPPPNALPFTFTP